jgi:Tol biopolymer transport system component
VLDNRGRLVAYTKGTRMRVLNRARGTTRTVPTGRPGVPQKRIVVYDKALSGNGRALLFITSDRHGFGEASDPGEYAVYRYEVRTRGVRRLTPFVADMNSVSASRTGRFVAYDGRDGVFVLDTRIGTKQRVPRARHGFDPAITGSGRYVTYSTSGAAFLYDRHADRTTRIAADAVYPSPAEHATRVVYGTTDDGSIGDAQGPFGDVFVWTRATGATRRITDNGRSGYAVIATNGSRVAFTSVPPIGDEDTNGVADVFAAGS